MMEQDAAKGKEEKKEPELAEGKADDLSVKLMACKEEGAGVGLSGNFCKRNSLGKTNGNHSEVQRTGHS